MQGGGVKGYAPGCVTQIQKELGNGFIRLRWTDPEDAVRDENTSATWAGTIVVRKENTPPQHPKDGTVLIDSKTRNQYQNTWLEDTGADEDGTLYYYRFFPYTSQKVYNMETDNIISSRMVTVSPVFMENSWEKIKSACDSGLYKTIGWQIGDTKQVYIGGETNRYVDFEIVAMDYDIDGNDPTYTQTIPLSLAAKEMIRPYPGKDAVNGMSNQTPEGCPSHLQAWYFASWMFDRAFTEWISKNPIDPDFLDALRPVYKRETVESGFCACNTKFYRYDNICTVSTFDLHGGDFKFHAGSDKVTIYNRDFDKATVKKYPVYTDYNAYASRGMSYENLTDVNTNKEMDMATHGNYVRSCTGRDSPMCTGVSSPSNGYISYHSGYSQGVYWLSPLCGCI